MPDVKGNISEVATNIREGTPDFILATSWKGQPTLWCIVCKQYESKVSGHKKFLGLVLMGPATLKHAISPIMPKVNPTKQPWC